MTRTIITPSYLAALLDSYAIGADAPGGAGLIEDRSLDRDFSEVRIDGTYDLTDVASELNTIDETGTSSGRALGMRRILIVVTALWFAYWSAALFFSIKDYRYTLRYNPGELGYVEMARNRVYGSIVASIVWPLIAYVVFLTLRWIWRGFKGSARA